MVWVLSQLRKSVRLNRAPGSFWARLRWLLASLLTLILFVGPAAAQTEVGDTLCGTPIADFINGVVPLVVGLAMIVGAVLAAFMHARAGVARDAEQARFYLDWRNRAGYTAVTAPLPAFIIQMLIGFTGTGIASCVKLVSFS
jgi:hypothetical protein